MSVLPGQQIPRSAKPKFTQNRVRMAAERGMTVRGLFAVLQKEEQIRSRNRLLNGFLVTVTKDRLRPDRIGQSMKLEWRLQWRIPP